MDWREKWAKIAPKIISLSTSMEGTSPYIVEKSDAIESEDKQSLREIQNKEAELARTASTLQGSALAIPLAPLIAAPASASTTAGALIGTGINAGFLTSGINGLYNDYKRAQSGQYNWKTDAPGTFLNTLLVTPALNEAAKAATTVKPLQTKPIQIKTVNTKKPWRDDPTKINDAQRFYLDGQEDRGYFELVKDFEPGNYSVHFKPTDATNPNAFSETEKQALFRAVADAVPVGGNLSTWGSVSKGGIHGLGRFADLGFTPTSTRSIVMKGTGEPVEIPVLTKNNYSAPKAIEISILPEAPIMSSSNSTQLTPEELKKAVRSTRKFKNTSEGNAEWLESLGLDVPSDIKDLFYERQNYLPQRTPIGHRRAFWDPDLQRLTVYQGPRTQGYIDLEKVSDLDKPYMGVGMYEKYIDSFDDVPFTAVAFDAAKRLANQLFGRHLISGRYLMNPEATVHTVDKYFNTTPVTKDGKYVVGVIESKDPAMIVKSRFIQKDPLSVPDKTLLDMEIRKEAKLLSKFRADDLMSIPQVYDARGNLLNDPIARKIAENYELPTKYRPGFYVRELLPGIKNDDFARAWLRHPFYHPSEQGIFAYNKGGILKGQEGLIAETESTDSPKPLVSKKPVTRIFNRDDFINTFIQLRNTINEINKYNPENVRVINSNDSIPRRPKIGPLMMRYNADPIIVKDGGQIV